METGTFWNAELQEKWCGNKKTDQLPHKSLHVVLFPTLIEIRSGKVSLRMLDKATKNNDLNIEVPGQNQNHFGT
jgi:hypothetical protein